jgi:hypothetical protein
MQRPDLSQRTRYLHSFADRGKVTTWLLGHGIYHPKQEVDKMWNRFVDQGRDYRIVIQGKKGRRPMVRFFRVYPLCVVCGVRLPKETTPADWGPGRRTDWKCPDCQDKDV